ENYGTLFIAEKGYVFLKHPETIMFSKDRDYEAEEEEEAPILKQKGGSALDTTLHQMLRDLRKKIAKRHNLPPFVIFQDPSLEDMATQDPVTMEEIRNIVGVGEGKAEKYGREFVNLIGKYVEENEVERPFDM